MSKAYVDARAQHGESELLDEIAEIDWDQTCRAPYDRAHAGL
jgi:hypothetical protein